MSAHALLTGHLIADPARRETKTGKPMATATLAVEVRDPWDATADPGMLFGRVAFGAAADALSGHAKGDTVAVTGILQRNQWTGDDGTCRERLSLVADGVLSAKASRATRRESGRRKAPAGGPAFFDDPVGF